jgi:hypothetical protein
VVVKATRVKQKNNLICCVFKKLELEKSISSFFIYNRSLFKYIFKTAKWSGFGNEKVFVSLPDIPLDRKFSNEELYEYFGLKKEEKDYVRTN